jgi:hypothetical protein
MGDKTKRPANTAPVRKRNSGSAEYAELRGEFGPPIRPSTKAKLKAEAARERYDEADRAEKEFLKIQDEQIKKLVNTAPLGSDEFMDQYLADVANRDRVRAYNEKLFAEKMAAQKRAGELSSRVLQEDAVIEGQKPLYQPRWGRKAGGQIKAKAKAKAKTSSSPKVRGSGCAKRGVKKCKMY